MEATAQKLRTDNQQIRLEMQKEKAQREVETGKIKKLEAAAQKMRTDNQQIRLELQHQKQPAGVEAAKIENKKIAANSLSVEQKHLQGRTRQQEVEGEEYKCDDRTAEEKDKKEFNGEFILFYFVSRR